MKVVSFIPIKLNNQRLPGKNLLPLDGKPMCEYIFDTIKNVKGIDEKYVYCSDRKIEPSKSEGSTPGGLILSGSKVKASLLKAGGGYS